MQVHESSVGGFPDVILFLHFVINIGDDISRTNYNELPEDSKMSLNFRGEIKDRNVTNKTNKRIATGKPQQEKLGQRGS